MRNYKKKQRDIEMAKDFTFKTLFKSFSFFFFRETPKAQETKAKVIGFHQTKSSLFI